MSFKYCPLLCCAPFYYSVLKIGGGVEYDGERILKNTDWRDNPYHAKQYDHVGRHDYERSCKDADDG